MKKSAIASGWDLGKIFAGECCSNGLSIGAFDEESNRLAGVFWNNDFAIEPEEGEMEAVVARSPDIHKLLQVLDSLVSKYCELRGPPQLGQTMVFVAVGGSPGVFVASGLRMSSQRGVWRWHRRKASNDAYLRQPVISHFDHSLRVGWRRCFRQDYDKAKVEDFEWRSDAALAWFRLSSQCHASFGA